MRPQEVNEQSHNVVSLEQPLAPEAPYQSLVQPTDTSISVPPVASSATLPLQSPPKQRSLTSFRTLAFWRNDFTKIVTFSAIAIVLLLGIGTLIVISLSANHNKQINYQSTPQPKSLPQASSSSNKLQLQDVLVNGQLYVNNGVIIKPGSQPANPSLGQLYLSSNTKQLDYFNGTSFVPIGSSTSPADTVLGVSSNLLKLGNGLSLSQNTLVNDGVTSLLGTANQISVVPTTGSVQLSLPSSVSLSGSITAGNFIGSGNGLTNLNADNLTTGNIPDAILNPNVTLTDRNNQIFSGGDQVFRNANDSTDAFSIQSANGTPDLNVNTLNNTITTGDLLPGSPGAYSSGITDNTIIANTYANLSTNSIIGADGFVEFAYSVFNNTSSSYDLHLVHCTNTDCSTYTDQVAVAGTQVNGQSTFLGSMTLALGSDGLAKLSYVYQYYDTGGSYWDYAVKYLDCTNANCSTNTQATIASVAGMYYNDPVIAIGSNGSPQIVYGVYNENDGGNTPGTILLSQCSDGTCVSVNTATLASSGDADSLTPANIVIGSDGFLRILYSDYNNNNSSQSVDFIQCTDAACTSPVSTTIDSTGNAETLEMGSNGLPILIYSDLTDGLTYAECTDANCSTSITTILDSNTADYGASLAIGQDGFARIVFTNNNSSPVYIDCTNATCSSNSQLNIDSNDNSVYGENSLVLGSDGLARVVYINSNLGSINFALFNTASGQNAVTGTNIGSTTQSYGTVYAEQIDTNGLRSSDSGQVLIQGSVNSINAFTVQDANGNSILNVNSVNDKVTISSGSASYLGSANLITNTDFTTSAWTGSSWTMTTTTATYAGSGNDILSTNQFSPTNGDTYQVTYTVTGNTDNGNGCVQVYLGNSSFSYECQDGTYITDVTTNSSGSLSFVPFGFNATISNVQIYQVNLSVAGLQLGSSLAILAPANTNSEYLGLDAGQYSLSSAEDNTALGSQSLSSNISGNNNTAIGTYALSSNTLGDYNTAIGGSALTSNYIGFNDTALGYGANVTIDGLQNATAIGANSQVNESNALILGCTDTYINCQTSVGIGTATPSAELNIVNSQPTISYGTITTTTNNSGSDTPGLESTWYNSDGNNNDYQTPGNGTLAAQFVDSTGNPTDHLGPANWPGIDGGDNSGEPNGVNSQYINAQWTGWIRADYTGNYTFSTTSDDGSRIYIGGVEALDNWYSQSATQRSSTVSLEGDTWYPITIQYFQGNGSALLSVDWQEQSINNNYTEAIPAANLSATEPNGAIYSGGLSAGSGADLEVENTNSLTNNLLDLVSSTNNTDLNITDSGQTVFENSTDSSTAFQVQNSSGSNVFDVDTQDKWVGIDNAAPANLLSIGALTTASSSAQVTVSTNGATNSGIVVQTVAGQSSGYILQAQSSTGSTLASLDYQGNLSVKNATVNGALTVNGHLITGNSSGTTTVTAGAADTCSSGSPSVTINGDDTAGTVTITTAAGSCSVGTLATVNFANSYGVAPTVVLTPVSASSATLQYYYGSATSNFTINSGTAPAAATTYTYSYIVMQ